MNNNDENKTMAAPTEGSEQAEITTAATNSIWYS